MAYTKLHQALVTSTIWREPSPTRIVWVTMMALADKNGEVMASIPGLADISRVTVEECETALAAFLAPDKYSRTKTMEGRRIQEIPGGWVLINHPDYRRLASKEDETEKASIRMARMRRNKANNTVTDRNKESPKVTVTENRDIAEAEANTDTEVQNTPVVPLKGTKVAEKGPLQLRAEAIFRRRMDSPLTKAELRAFKNSKAVIEATSEEDWLLLERFYGAPQQETFARKDLATLVNNWNGEIDRARAHEGKSEGNLEPRFKGAF